MIKKMDEKYFSADIAVFNGEDCVDGFTVIIENLYRKTMRGVEHCGYNLPVCFMNAIEKRIGEDFTVDFEGSENAFCHIYI